MLKRGSTIPWRWFQDGRLRIICIVAALLFMHSPCLGDDEHKWQKLGDGGLQIEPADQTEFEVCTGKQQQRYFRIVNRGSGSITVSEISLRGHDYFKIGQLTLRSGQKMKPGDSGSLNIDFRPLEQETVSTELSVLYRRGQDYYTGTLALTGKGTACAPAEELDPQTGDPVPAGNETPEENAEQGLDPIKIACVKFIYAGWPGDEGKPGPEVMDGWLDEVNEIFGQPEIRVKFKRWSGEIPEIEPEASQEDEPPGWKPNQSLEEVHCVNVYVVPPNPGNDRSGHTKGFRSKQAKELGDGAGGDRDYIPHQGSYSEVEMEGDEARTLAHEIGHYFGLGGSHRNDPAGSDRHRDPENPDTDITDHNRLMHGEEGTQEDGTEVTDLEKAIFNALAYHFASGFEGRCGTCCLPLDDPTDERQVAYADLEDARIKALDDKLSIGFRTREAFSQSVLKEAEPTLTLQFDNNLDGVADLTVGYSYSGMGWSMFTQPAPTPAPLEPPEPLVDSHDAEGRISGFVVNVPKNVLPLFSGKVGCRLTWSLGAQKEMDAIPDVGFVQLDITLPIITIDFAEAKFSGNAGGWLEVNGPLFSSVSVAGDISLTLGIETKKRAIRYKLGILKKPLPDSWKARIRLPENLPGGPHRLLVEAGCDLCGLTTTAQASLEVTRQKQ